MVVEADFASAQTQPPPRWDLQRRAVKSAWCPHASQSTKPSRRQAAMAACRDGEDVEHEVLRAPACRDFGGGGDQGSGDAASAGVRADLVSSARL